MKLISIALLFPLIAGTAAHSQNSNAARYLMNEEIQGACGGNGGIAPEFFIERDLTGDGRDDLLVAHEGITCGSGGRSGFCGAQVCSVNVYVREGALLKLKTEALGGGVRVGAGPVPQIMMFAHGGAQTILQWNGQDFAWR